MRIVETLDKDLQTVNVWSVPMHISLDKVIKKQDDTQFRDAYLVSSHPKE